MYYLLLCYFKLCGIPYFATVGLSEGVAAARGDILVFLDSHCECGTDWLQPLVQAVVEIPSKV